MLFWETIGFISPTTVKLRIKSTDGLMSATDDGIQLFNVVESGDTSQITYKQFRWSLGFGHKNYNYDDFFSLVSNHPDYEDKFASLGNGIGVVESSYRTLMPYTYMIDHDIYDPQWYDNNDNIRVSNITWETYDVSCFVEIYIPKWTKSYEYVSDGSMSAEFGQNVHSNNNIYTQTLPNIWGDAPFLNYDEENLHNISFDDVDDYNILISLTLRLGNIYINPVTKTVLDNLDFEFYTVYVPVHFTTSVYDFNVALTQISTPTTVNEAETALIQLNIQSTDYAGGVEIYLLDKDSKFQVNLAIGADIEQFYGTIEDDVVAQYGQLRFAENNTYKLNTQILQNEAKNFIIEYEADNVNAGQNDSFAIFVKYDDLDPVQYTDNVYDASYQFSLLPIDQKYVYSDNQTIFINDVEEEFIETYNPSDIMITKPSDIVHHILATELGFDENNVDIESKTQSRLVHNDYNLGFSVHEEIEAKKLIEEICQSTQMVATLASDTLKFISINNTYFGNEDISTIQANDVFSYNFTRTPLEDIKTQIEVKYEKDYGLDKYLSSTDILQVNTNNYFLTGTYSDYLNANIESVNYYGIEAENDIINHVNTMLTFESNYIRNANTANALAQYLLQFYKNQHNIVTLKLPLKYYGLEIGDLIEFDELIHGKKVYNETYVFDRPDDMPIRCGQYILPLFIITETKKTISGLTIKAMQLHHLSDTQLQYKGFSFVAPVIETPEEIQAEYSVLDVVTLCASIVGTVELNETQIQRYDVDGSGTIDVLDVVAMVLEII